MSGYSWEERGTVEWEENGATYTLMFDMYAYDDPEDKVAGSGVRNLYLTIVKKGKDGKDLHIFEEIEVERLKQKHQDEFHEVAETEMGEYRD